MSELLVSQQAIQRESGQKTWADLLHAVEVRAGAGGEVVTAARFEGVDQPSFRGPREWSLVFEAMRERCAA